MIRYFRVLWRNIRHREGLDEDLDAELGAYFDAIVADKIRSGAIREDALREARRELGGVEQVKQTVRDARTGASMETLIQDLRFALRTLVRNIGFSTVIILTLALGIGANSAIFTLVNGILVKPLPYPEPDRLLMLWETSADRLPGTVAPANFYDWRAQSHSFEKMAAIDAYPDFILNGTGEARRLTGAAVSGDFFSLFGVRMGLGRDFLAEEDHPGTNHVVILGYSTWQQYFGGRTDIAGRAIRLNDADYTVVGVLPRDFTFVSKSADYRSRTQFDVWTPMGLASPPAAWLRGTHPLCVFARLKPGVSVQQAQADLDQIAVNLGRLYPGTDKNRGILAVSLGQHVVGGVRLALYTLLATVGMVLLLACANIANLMLTRGAARQKEIAVRIALGAGRQRIARQLVTENLVLAITGGLTGLLLVFVGVPSLVRHLPADLPRASEISVDWRVLVFTSLLTVSTGIVFGLFPLRQARQVSANDSLKQGGQTIVIRQNRIRSFLLVGQFAVAVILLNGAGLMTKSLWKLMRVSPGFQVERVLTARLSLPPKYTNGYKYGTGRHREISAFQREVLERVRSIPGVQSAAFASYLPLSGVDNSWSFDIEGRPAKPAGVDDSAKYRPATAGYFETIGIPLVHGRYIDADDVEDKPLVVVINESMARRFWGAQNPIGQRVRIDGGDWRAIVGVVGDVQHKELGTSPEPEMYLPYGQVPNVEARPMIVLRTSVEPTSVTSALRKAVAEVDPNVPMDQVETMRQMVYGSVGESRFRTAILAIFACLALFVASIGLYGVMSYSVTQRTREFGIRMAVGASRSAILGAVLAKAAKLVGIGLGLGTIGAVLLARLIATLLYGVTPFDIATLVSVSILLALVALIASYVPARRASSINPMDSLRCE